ncbi:DNA repair and recombination protein RadB [Methanolobus sp. ZRKC2]|uniref:DNA repair and recombination protein RadB n=1 Tax=unclassified Methanolobus TaxID=2629569 RepID=UPI00324476F8
MTKQLSSGSQSIDKLLEGGFETGIVTQIFGEAGSGKTNLCMQLAIECVKKGKKVIYIDTEAISPQRFKQIAGEDAKEIAREIIIFEPTSFEEQYAAVKEIEKLASDRIGLIVVDSATAFYRFELDQEESSIRSRRELANQIGFLHSIARKHKLAVVITNQVYSDVVTGTLKPIGGSGIEHISKTIFQLEKTGEGTRRAKLWKHRSIREGSTCNFEITNEGIR